MRIKSSPKTSGVVPSRAVEPGARRRVSVSDDHVELGHKELQAAIRAAEQQASLERQEKLQSLERAIAEGTYRPDPHRLAEEVLRSAVLLARLRALLK